MHYRESAAYHSVPAESAVKVSLPGLHELMIANPHSCQELFPRAPMRFTPETATRMKKDCSPLFTFTRADLYEAAKSILSSEYRTCLFLRENGTLEARTEHSTPWPVNRKKGKEEKEKRKRPCANPDAELSRSFDIFDQKVSQIEMNYE
jgi:hypothetical protein